jgi:hypothetical protein
MEKYLNPIYGLYMYKSGFISNIFFLNKANLLDELIDKNKLMNINLIDLKDKAKIINNIYNNNGINRPSDDIINSINNYLPEHIGVYIA